MPFGNHDERYFADEISSASVEKSQRINDLRREHLYDSHFKDPIADHTLRVYLWDLTTLKSLVHGVFSQGQVPEGVRKSKRDD